MQSLLPDIGVHQRSLPLPADGSPVLTQAAVALDELAKMVATDTASEAETGLAPDSSFGLPARLGPAGLKDLALGLRQMQQIKQLGNRWSMLDARCHAHKHPLPAVMVIGLCVWKPALWRHVQPAQRGLCRQDRIMPPMPSTLQMQHSIAASALVMDCIVYQTAFRHC